MNIHDQARKAATRHILDAITSDGFEDCAFFNPCGTEKDKAEFSHGRFMSEYRWNVDQHGTQKAVINWLQGLALSIDYMNCDILRNAVLWGSLSPNATPAQEDKLLASYWSYMSLRLLSLWRKHGLEV